MFMVMVLMIMGDDHGGHGDYGSEKEDGEPNWPW